MLPMITSFCTMPTPYNSTGDSSDGFTECLGNGHTKLQPAARGVSAQGRKYSYLFSFIGLLGWTIAEGSTGALEEVTVTATLLTEASPALSATVLAEQHRQQRGAVHLENMISLAPNIASSS